MRESTELAAYWRGGGRAPVWYLADPARGDLELIDPLSRRVQAHYGWMFPREAFISGVRPDILDLVSIESPPGWFAETGWHLTPETLNISEQQGRAEGVAYIRNRPDAALLVLGGESFSGGGNTPARVSADDRRSRRSTNGTSPAGGRFFKRIMLEPGTLAGDGRSAGWWLSYKGADGRPERVRLTQLMIAPPQSVFHVQHAGWNEIGVQRSDAAPLAVDDGRAETFVNAGRTRSHADDRRRIAAALFRCARRM